MDSHDALFENIQAISDDADALGLTDAVLVLEFAMDVFLRDACPQDVVNPTPKHGPEQPHLAVSQDVKDEPALGWSMSNFPMMHAN